MSAYFDIILTDAGGHVGLQVARSLVRRGLRVCLCDNSRNPAKQFGNVSVRHLPLTRDESNFIKAVKQIALESGARMVIPLFYPEVLARHRAEFEGIIIPVDTPEKLNLLDSKLLACELAAHTKASCIGLPRIYESIELIERYPVVFKRCNGHGGDSVYFPKNRSTLDNLVSSSAPGSWLITEEIDGEDVSIDALSWGEFFHAGAYKVILPRAKGISVLRESIEAPSLVEFAKSLLESIDYQGVCGMDFRLDKNGKFWFLECNPRFSGGISSQIASGFDMPWLLWILATGSGADNSELADIQFRSGVRSGNIEGMKECLGRMKRMGKLRISDLWHFLFHRISFYDDDNFI